MERPGLLIGQLLFYALLIGGIVWLIVYVVRRSGSGAQPSQATQARWQHAVQICSADPRYRLGQVTSISQVHPQRGTMAWVTWYGTGQPQSTWFEHAYPPVGGWVVVSGANAHDPNMFHVSRVHDIIV